LAALAARSKLKRGALAVNAVAEARLRELTARQSAAHSIEHLTEGDAPRAKKFLDPKFRASGV
jgi:hypothetical protein